MQGIGRVKFFGKSYDGRDLDYGEISCDNAPKLRFWKQSVKCNINDLRKGNFVTFDVEGNRAVNVDILREIGIIKWLRRDGYQINYGVIELIRDDISDHFLILNENGKPEIFFHNNQVSCSPDLLLEGVLITFEIKRTYQKRKDTYRDEAFKIIPLSDETNLELIERCIKSQDQRLWKPIFEIYLNTLNNIEEKISLVLDKVHLLNRGDQNHFIQSLSTIFLLKSPEIRQVLKNINDKKDYLDILITLVQESKKLNDDSVYTELLNELRVYLEFFTELQRPFSPLIKHRLPLISSQKNNLCKYDEIWLKIPPDILLTEVIWNIVPPTFQIDAIKYYLSTENIGFEPKIAKLMFDIISSCPQKNINSLIAKIPEDYKINEPIFNLLTGLDKIKTLVIKLEQTNQNENEVNQIINRIGQLIEKSTEAEKKEFFLEIPDYIKTYQEIFNLLSPGEQIRILTQFYELTPPIISYIENLIKQYKYNIPLNQIPIKIRDYPSIRSLIFPFLEVHLRTNHPDYHQIINFVKGRDIKYIVHLTTLSNLEKICQSGAILSRQQIQNLGIDSTPFDPNRLDRRLNHICCSITYYNFQMFYRSVHLENQSCVILQIKPDYLWKQNTLFCPINAAARQGALISSGLAGLQKMFSDNIRDNKGLQTRQEKPANLPTCIQAEVLIHESISWEDVVAVFVRHDWDKEQAIEVGCEEDKIQISPDYFEYRSDWIVKDNNI